MKLPRAIPVILVSLILCSPSLSLAVSLQVDDYWFHELTAEQKETDLVVSGSVTGKPRCRDFRIKVVLVNQSGKKKIAQGGVEYVDEIKERPFLARVEVSKEVTYWEIVDISVSCADRDWLNPCVPWRGSCFFGW